MANNVNRAVATSTIPLSVYWYPCLEQCIKVELVVAPSTSWISPDLYTDTHLIITLTGNRFSPRRTSAVDNMPRSNSNLAQIVAFGHIVLRSPIHWLPAELLIYIWQTAIGDLLSISYDNMLPVRVAQVCRRWRDVALAAPGLWSNIYVNPSWCKSSPLARVSLSLARSSKHPLRIVFHYDFPRRNDPKHMLTVLTLLARESRRWQTCHIHITWETETDHRMISRALQPAQAPQLVQLVLHAQRRGAGSSLRPAWFPMGLPALTDFGLANAMDLRPYLHLLSGLTSLSLEVSDYQTPATVSHRDFQAALARCPHLVHLELRFACVAYGDVDTVPSAYAVIHLPKLRSLFLRMHDEDCRFVSVFFRRFSAPSLKVIKMVHWSRHAFDVFVSAVTDDNSFFLCHSLETLSLVDVDCGSDDSFGRGLDEDGKVEVEGAPILELEDDEPEEADEEVVDAASVLQSEGPSDSDSSATDDDNESGSQASESEAGDEHGAEDIKNSFRRFISHFPSTTTLIVGDSCLRELLEGMSMLSEAGEVACPRLRTLIWSTIVPMTSYTLPLQLIGDFIRKRVSLGLPLAQLRVQKSHFLELGVPLREWVQTQVAVDLYDKSQDYDPDPHPEV